jgi:hypothetical protein
MRAITRHLVLEISSLRRAPGFTARKLDSATTAAFRVTARSVKDSDYSAIPTRCCSMNLFTTRR